MTEVNIQKVQERFMQLFEIAIRKLRWHGKGEGNDILIYKGSAITAAETAMKQVNRELLLNGCPYKDTWKCNK